MKIKDRTVFALLSHGVMIVVTIMAVLPFLLVFLSSITEENTLVLHGYSFFPKKFSLYAYAYIVKKGGKIFRAYCVTVFVKYQCVYFSDVSLSLIIKGFAGAEVLDVLCGVYPVI